MQKDTQDAANTVLLNRKAAITDTRTYRHILIVEYMCYYLWNHDT